MHDDYNSHAMYGLRTIVFNCLHGGTVEYCVLTSDKEVAYPLGLSETEQPRGDEEDTP